MSSFPAALPLSQVDRAHVISILVGAPVFSVSFVLWWCAFCASSVSQAEISWSLFWLKPCLCDLFALARSC
jgi:hypothetical protein